MVRPGAGTQGLPPYPAPLPPYIASRPDRPTSGWGLSPLLRYGNVACKILQEPCGRLQELARLLSLSRVAKGLPDAIARRNTCTSVRLVQRPSLASRHSSWAPAAGLPPQPPSHPPRPRPPLLRPHRPRPARPFVTLPPTW